MKLLCCCIYIHFMCGWWAETHPHFLCGLLSLQFSSSYLLIIYIAAPFLNQLGLNAASMWIFFLQNILSVRPLAIRNKVNGRGCMKSNNLWLNVRR